MEPVDAAEKRRQQIYYAPVVPQLQAPGCPHNLPMSLDTVLRAGWSPSDKPVVALVLMGGGARTAYQVGVLRALAAWRDDEARIDDVNPRNVLADGILLDLARRQPREISDIQSDRRVPRGFGKRYGDELLGRIVEARALRDEDLPAMLDRQEPLARVVDLLQCIADAEGAAAGWATRLVAPRHALERAVLEAPGDRTHIASILGNWRDALAGDTLHAALGGQRTLQIRGADVAILTLPDVQH